MNKRTRFDVRDDTASLVNEMGLMVIEDNRKRMHPIKCKNIGNPKLCIIDSEVASGKTRAIINLINNSCNSSITFVEQTHTAESIANHSKAIAITSKDVRRVHDVDLKMVNETVLEHLHHRMSEGETHFVLTHSSLENILKTNDYQGFLYNFEGIFIDELFKSHHLETYRWFQLKELYSEFSLDVEHKDSDVIASFIADINKIIKNENSTEIILLDTSWMEDVDFQGIESELIETIEKRKQKNVGEQINSSLAVRFIRELMDSYGFIYYFQKSGNYHNFVVTKSFLPERMSCLVCSDNAMKDSSMMAMSLYADENKIDIEEAIIQRGDWSSHHIHWQITSTKKDHAIEEFESSPQDYLSKMDKLEKGLFILPKDISLKIDSAIDEVREIDSADEIAQKNKWNNQKQRDMVAGDTKHDLTSWGRHKGTNLFSDNDAVYIPTLFHKPKHATSAGWVAVSCKDGSKFEQDEYDKQELELKGLYADVKNLIGRVKRTEDNIQDRVDVYICFPDEHTAGEMKELFKEDMPECLIDDDETHWWKEPETAKLDNLLDEIIAQMGDTEDATLSKLIGNGQMFRNMRHRDPEQWVYLKTAANDRGYHIHKPAKNKHWRFTALK